MGALASVLAFFFFLAGSVVMVSGVGEGGGMGWLTTNLPTTILWSAGVLILSVAVFLSRNKAR